VRILFLTNYYPPASHGGYEQWCQEVAAELARRGHLMSVLTSKAKGSPDELIDGEVSVYRRLNLEVEGGLPRTIARLIQSRKAHEAESINGLRETLTTFQPDAALVWGMWNIPRSVPALLEGLLDRRVAYYLCDYWPSLPSAYVQQLTNPAVRWYTDLPKRIVGRIALALAPVAPPPPLRLANALCVSRAVGEILARQGVSLEGMRVVQGGIQVEDFPPVALARPGSRRGIRLLYAGRLAPDKGVHTAIQAMALVQQRSGEIVTLDIVGNGDPHYVRNLQDLVRKHRLSTTVRFRSGVPRSDMPRLLAEYDSLLFPSEWDEPFSRVVMEAMATGLIVIGTLTGGTGDILVEGETGLTFPVGQAPALARQVERLRDDPELGEKLAKTARQTVVERFHFSRMVDEIVDALTAAASSRSPREI